QHDQPVIYGNLDYVMDARHLGAFMRRKLVGGAKAEAAPVHIKHHRTAARKAWRPDVQLEHVFADPAIIPVLQECLLNACPGVEGLRTIRAIDQGGALVSPWL